MQVLCLFRVALIKSAIFVNNFFKPIVSPIFMREGASAVYKGHGRFSQYCVLMNKQSFIQLKAHLPTWIPTQNITCVSPSPEPYIYMVSMENF